MRTLIYVPVIHSEADLGTMAAAVRQEFLSLFGAEAWAQRADAVESMWDGIRAKLLARSLEWPRVRVYQDGLPICGQEEAIAREVAAKGSLNHRLLVELNERGATLLGTEDPALLVREYQRIQAIMRAARAGAPAEQTLALEREGEEILRARDAFIAQRLDSTLGEGETGILFIGLLHRVDEHLREDFVVEHLIDSLPFGTDARRRRKGDFDNGG